MSPVPDPYRTLGVRASASDAELRAAYRRLVQLHHPDHNGGSAESARRFEEVQEAYAQVRRLRGGGAGPAAGAAGAAAGAGGSGAGGAGAASGPNDPDLDARLAAMERELKAARDARERAVREARAATEQTLRDLRGDAEDGRGRASDEELGYYSTNDSFTKILDDFADQVAARFAEAHPPQGDPSRKRKGPARPRSVADWIDELGSRLTGEPRRGDDD